MAQFWWVSSVHAWHCVYHIPRTLGFYGDPTYIFAVFQSVLHTEVRHANEGKSNLTFVFYKFANSSFSAFFFFGSFFAMS